MLNEVVGNYKILDKIGEGGMGEVFKAIDVMLEREVAIKVLRPELAGKSDIVARFRKEAVVLAKLNHPNIATLYNFVHHGDRYFMVMEFAHGRTLDVIIDRHPNGLPWRRSLELFLDALHAIEHAHNLDIVHRDVKPSNMMVNDRGILKVLDFGIARMLGSARLTRVGLFVGTLKYMSPEQIHGRDTDARSDIYSLGIVLYKMLSGRMPFAAEGEFGSCGPRSRSVHPPCARSSRRYRRRSTMRCCKPSRSPRTTASRLPPSSSMRLGKRYAKMPAVSLQGPHHGVCAPNPSGVKALRSAHG